MKIYLSAALTHAPEEFKVFIENLRIELKKDFEVLDFFGLGPGEPKDVYLYDKKCLDDCDLVMADVSYPALGVGYEIGYALAAHKRVMAFAKTDSYVGRMIKGITDPNFSFQTYKEPSEIIQAVKNL